MNDTYARDFIAGYRDGGTDARNGVTDACTELAAPGYRDGYQRAQAELTEPYAGEMYGEPAQS
jgi:hypothetical protein